MSSDLDQLERLERLRTSGALSEAEFEQEKARLLRPSVGGQRYAGDWRSLRKFLFLITAAGIIAITTLLLMPAPKRAIDAQPPTARPTLSPSPPVDPAPDPLRQPIDEPQSQATRPSSASKDVAETGPQEPSADLKAGRCLLRVEGIDHINGPCFISLDQDGSFSVFERQDRTGYFGMLLRDGPVGRGYWNGSRDSTHAHDELGELRREGACWVNSTSRICAWS